MTFRLNVGSSIGSLLYLYNLIYAFVFWGFGWGLLNLFIPFAVLADLAKRFGKF